MKKIDHDGTRTHNLLIRSQTPYPLGHAAGRRKPSGSQPNSGFFKKILFEIANFW